MLSLSLALCPFLPVPQTLALVCRPGRALGKLGAKKEKKKKIKMKIAALALLIHNNKQLYKQNSFKLQMVPVPDGARKAVARGKILHNPSTGLD